MDLQAWTIRVERGVIKVPGGYQVGPPKTEAEESFASVCPRFRQGSGIDRASRRRPLELDAVRTAGSHVRSRGQEDKHDFLGSCR